MKNDKDTEMGVKKDICGAKIVDSKDEAVFCDGQCQQWIHRYFAGVSKTQFNLLSSSAESKYECARSPTGNNSKIWKIQLLPFKLS